MRLRRYQSIAQQIAPSGMAVPQARVRPAASAERVAIAANRAGAPVIWNASITSIAIKAISA